MTLSIVDGIFVHQHRAQPAEAMLCYKNLWTLEQTFWTAKHLLATRPIFHKAGRDHLRPRVLRFLALVLKKAQADGE